MTITSADHEPMRLAIEASREAVAAGNMPFGATAVSPAGELLWTAQNNQISAALSGDSLPIRTARTLAGAMPAVEVDGPVLAEPAIAVLREYATMHR